MKIEKKIKPTLKKHCHGRKTKQSTSYFFSSLSSMTMQIFKSDDRFKRNFYVNSMIELALNEDACNRIQCNAMQINGNYPKRTHWKHTSHGHTLA